MADGGSSKTYGAMMKSMDAGIGRVLEALERAKLDRETLVIFTSDNGGERYSFNWPFSFQKMYLYEGGTRVPAMARWPGVVPPGGVTEQAAITMDWTATILAATGTAADPARPLDGVDLLPVCTGARPAFDRVLAHHRLRRGPGGPVEIPQDGEGRVPVRLVGRPGREGRSALETAGHVEEVRRKYQDWSGQMLPLPAK
jgi:arylsulfatase A-like enzyme